MASGDLALLGAERAAIALARRLMTLDRREAKTIEQVLTMTVDPLYEQATTSKPMRQMLAFREAVRSVAGLPGAGN